MNNKKLTVKDSSLTFFVGFLLCQLAVVVATCLGLIVCKIFKIETTEFELFVNTGFGYLILTLALDITMLIIFFYFNKNKNYKIISKPKLNKTFLYILIALASFFCLYPIIVCIDSLIVKCGFKINTLPYSLSTSNYFISLLSLVLLPAICEELLFRGIIFKGLKKHGKLFSIIITAIMFCLFHMSISQSVYPLIMGLLLSVIMFYENNIYYCILIHLINNFTSLTLSYFNINLVFNHWTYILLAIILAVVVISIILYFVIKDSKNSEKQPLSSTDKKYLYTSLTIMGVFWILTLFV